MPIVRATPPQRVEHPGTDSAPSDRPDTLWDPSPEARGDSSSYLWGTVLDVLYV